MQLANAALIRGPQLEGAEGPFKQVTSVSNGLVVTVAAEPTGTGARRGKAVVMARFHLLAVSACRAEL